MNRLVTFRNVIREAWDLFGPMELVALAALIATIAVWAVTIATIH